MRYTLLINSHRTSFSFFPIIPDCDIEIGGFMTNFINAESREKKSAVRLTNTVWQMERLLGFRGSTLFFPQCISPYIEMGYFQRYTRPRIRLPIQTSLSRLINARWYLIDDPCNTSYVSGHHYLKMDAPLVFYDLGHLAEGR